MWSLLIRITSECLCLDMTILPGSRAGHNPRHKEAPCNPSLHPGLAIILPLLSALWESGYFDLGEFLLCHCWPSLLFDQLICLFVSNILRAPWFLAKSSHLSHSALMLLCAITDKPIYLDPTFQYLVRIQLQQDNNTSKGREH